MIKRQSASFLLILPLILSIIRVCHASSNSNRKSSIYPVSNLEASLAASAGQASVIAVRCNDCVVIMSMSPQQTCYEFNKAKNSESAADKESDDSDLIPILSRGSVRTPIHVNGRTIKKASRIIHILQEKPGLVLCLTGFSSDAEYLCRYAAGHVSEHEYLYGGTNMNAQSLIRDALAPQLREATMGGGSRPFGVQGLAISSPRGGSPMQLITIDPSGNYRYWSGPGTCIGKDSELIKKHLHQALQNKPFSSPNGWTEGVDICMKALLETVEESQNMKETPREEILSELDAVVIFDNHLNSRRYSCAMIDKSAMMRSFQKCHSAMTEKTAKKPNFKE